MAEDCGFLRVNPAKELVFPFVKGQGSKTQLELANLCPSNVAFKVKTTAPRSYLVRPNQGILPQGESLAVQIIMQPTSEEALGMTNDKFLLQYTTTTLATNQHEDLQSLWQSVPKDRLQSRKIKVQIVKEGQSAAVPSSYDERIVRDKIKVGIAEVGNATYLESWTTAASSTSAGNMVEDVRREEPVIDSPGRMGGNSNNDSKYTDLVSRLAEVTEEKKNLQKELTKMQKLLKDNQERRRPVEETTKSQGFGYMQLLIFVTIAFAAGYIMSWS
eukprot:CAMPEP_0115012644 /NCGR_PEP_ID=MMETSP0216-20121206/24874_1 /TAXON_ID=223996 /ORGANISM="Protocruzia adherens, Strain Boccale" /LENGTH=272 /DNA_ID=CAMNT_0002381769 /DNA_START=26 /DNA_END=844 /DNA_ORIENTATION=+